MKRIEEMVKLIKSNHAFGFTISILLILSLLVVIPLLNDAMLQVITGVFVLLVLVYFSRLLKERLRLKQVLQFYKHAPKKSLESLDKQIKSIKRRMKNEAVKPEEGQLNYKSISKIGQELLQYEQLREAIIEEHDDL
jgi:hypothetical protein